MSGCTPPSVKVRDNCIFGLDICCEDVCRKTTCEQVCREYAPVCTTRQPTGQPTRQPTKQPTVNPTSKQPTSHPTNDPTTATPTTLTPTYEPSAAPIHFPKHNTVTGIYDLVLSRTECIPSHDTLGNFRGYFSDCIEECDEHSNCFYVVFGYDGDNQYALAECVLLDHFGCESNSKTGKNYVWIRTNDATISPFATPNTGTEPEEVDKGKPTTALDKGESNDISHGSSQLFIYLTFLVIGMLTFVAFAMYYARRRRRRLRQNGQDRRDWSIDDATNIFGDSSIQMVTPNDVVLAEEIGDESKKLVYPMAKTLTMT